MGTLVFQATLGGQVNLSGPNTASTFTISVPAVTGNMITSGDTGTVTNTMLASSAYTAPGTIGSGTPNTGAFTTLSASSTVSGTGFSTYLASPPAIGGTAPSTGKFTTLTTTSAIATTSGGTGLTSFTANGVVYASSTSALATGSALTFDGTNFATTGLVIAKNGWFTGRNAPASGLGMEVFSDSVNGNILAFNRSLGTYIGAVYDGLTHAWQVSSSEQMRLTSTGLLVGTTSNPNNSKLMVGGTVQVKPATNNSLEIFGPNSGTGIRLFARNDAGTLNRLELQGGQVIFPLTSGADGLYFDASSGNLGLGVTPSAWGSAYKPLQMGNSSFSGAVAAFVGNAQTFVTSNAYHNGTNWIYANTSGAGYYQIAGVSSGAHAWYTAPSGTAGNAITFTQAMTLDASGNLLVGTTTNGRQDVNSITLEPKVSGGGYAVFNHATGSSSGRQFQSFAYAGTEIGSITQSGTTAVLYNLTSDQRLKTNIVDADSASSLIDSLQVRQYDWKADGSHQRYGFIAQELVTVAPEAVHQPIDPEEMMAVDYSKLVPMLVKEIQSLRKRLAAANI